VDDSAWKRAFGPWLIMSANGAALIPPIDVIMLVSFPVPLCELVRNMSLGHTPPPEPLIDTVMTLLDSDVADLLRVSTGSEV
jgi:hypothetical protein